MLVRVHEEATTDSRFALLDSHHRSPPRDALDLVVPDARKEP